MMDRGKDENECRQSSTSRVELVASILLNESTKSDVDRLIMDVMCVCVWERWNEGETELKVMMLADVSISSTHLAYT